MLEKTAKHLEKHPYIAIILITILSLFFIYQTRFLIIDIEYEELLPED